MLKRSRAVAATLSILAVLIVWFVLQRRAQQERGLARELDEMATVSAREDRITRLRELSREAWRAGRRDEAARYASQLLAVAEGDATYWDAANGIHQSHIILGSMALSRGEEPEALMHLIAAGRVSGSPQLDSFGPDMTLARALLARGRRSQVQDYLELCRRFWQSGVERLRGWEEQLRAGDTPDLSSEGHWP